jgi:hypothetical protein
LLPWKSNNYYIIWVCVCSNTYPAWSVLAPYYTVTVARLVLPYFTILSHKRHDFSKKDFFNVKSVYWFSSQLLSETYLILCRTEHDIINVLRSSYKVPVSCHILMNSNETGIFSTDFCKMIKYQILWKSAQWKQICTMWTERQTDRFDKANSHFLQFCECA